MRKFGGGAAIAEVVASPGMHSLARELRSRVCRSTGVIHINRNVWTVALWLVAKHGPDAVKIVSTRISQLGEGDLEQSAITSWLQVDQAVQELVRAPDEGERLN